MFIDVFCVAKTRSVKCKYSKPKSSDGSRKDLESDGINLLGKLMHQPCG